MVKKQRKRDKEDNMFIKRRCVCRQSHARKKATRTKRALPTEREGGGRDERRREERRGEGEK